MATTQTTLRPLNDFVLLKPDAVKPYHEHKGYQHIIVPDAFQHGPEDRPVWGTVVAKGSSCRDSRIDLQCHVLIEKWEGARVAHNGAEYILVKESDILAVDESTAVGRIR